MKKSSGPRTGRPRRRFGIRRKVCHFCENKIGHVDFKDPHLRNFLNERGKIVPGKLSGTCTRHQRALTLAIKTARSLAMLPFSA